MTFQGRFRWSLGLLTILGALVAAVVVPGAMAKPTPGPLVQIGGELVAPSQLSSWQAHVGQVSLPASHLVQIGGKLVPPSKVSSWQAHSSQPISSPRGNPRTTVNWSSSDGTFDWSAATAGFVGFAVVLGSAGFVVRGRRRIATA